MLVDKCSAGTKSVGKSLLRHLSESSQNFLRKRESPEVRLFSKIPAFLMDEKLLLDSTQRQGSALHKKSWLFWPQN